MTNTAIEVYDLPVGATETVAIDFTDRLRDSALLTGTPLIVEVTTSDLTLGSKLVNTAAITINGTSVAIGKAVTFSATGATAGQSYTIKVTCSTNESVVQTWITNYQLQGIAAS